MSIVKDINELHIGVKSSILTVLCQMPFFFISIFLLKHELVDNISSNILSDMNFYYLLSLCFCFSLTWFFINIILVFLSLSLADTLAKTTSEPHELYIASLLQSIVYLCIVIAVSYFIKANFRQFIGWSYTYIIFRVVWVFISMLVVRKVKK